MIPVSIVVIGILIGGGLCFADWWICVPQGTQATYVGRNTCARCHEQEVREWTGSHHDLAMDIATPETVLGDFSDVTLDHFGISSRMFKQDDRFMIHTEGPNGKMRDFEIKYVFGVEPLQQYMVEFDRPEDMPASEIARLQVLRVSWDTRAMRWFYLSPPDVDEATDPLDPDDVLHWTGRSQCWNTTCADCHSTNLKKNFDAATKTYHTTFSEIDVSCEACHGPGSTHVELAEAKSLFWDRKLGYGLAKLKGENNAEQEIQACAPCHSHRQVIHPGYQPGASFHDFFQNAKLHSHLYHPDGQIQEEVYVYGSFTQSKMYHKGIRCSDCHDPHSVRLKHDGNKVCTSCHTHPAAKYDTTAHHHHQDGSTGAQCVECHMPSTTYMAVDPRRDHSLRIPRPDLSVEIGTPNACTQCHLNKLKLPQEKRANLKQYADWLHAAEEGDLEIAAELGHLNQWASDAVARWYGKERKDDKQYAAVFARADNPDAETITQLQKIVKNRGLPAIVRSTALFHLGNSDSADSLEIAMGQLNDQDPQVRASAVTRLDTEIQVRSRRIQLAPSASAAARLFEPIVEQLVPLLRDPSRVVRIEAARALAGIPSELRSRLLESDDRKALKQSLKELKAGLLLNNDHASAHAVIGSLNEMLGDMEAAVASYKQAIHVEPGVPGPRKNLAAIYDQYAQEERPGNWQAEAKRLRGEELGLLERDARLAPDIASVQYQYGLALYNAGQHEKALLTLRKANRLSPDTPQFAFALALFYMDKKQWAEALPFAERIVELRPRNLEYAQILRQIRANLTGP